MNLGSIPFCDDVSEMTSTCLNSFAKSDIRSDLAAVNAGPKRLGSHSSIHAVTKSVTKNLN